MEKQWTNALFHTPETMEELENWLIKTKDPLVLTGAMMMYNLMVTQMNKMLEELQQ